MRNKNPIDAIFSRPLQEILSAILLEREEPWYLSDLAKRLGRTPSTLQRPLESLLEAGILERSEDGNRVYYARNKQCPILPELRGLLVKTVGLVDILKSALKTHSKSIEVAFIYGSIARGEETSQSDVDIFLIGDITLSKLTPALTKLETQLGRPVNVTIQSQHEFRDKLAAENHFLLSVLAKEKIFVIGTQDDLEGLSTKGTRRRPRDQQSGTGRSTRGRKAKS